MLVSRLLFSWLGRRVGWASRLAVVDIVRIAGKADEQQGKVSDLELCTRGYLVDTLRKDLRRNVR